LSVQKYTQCPPDVISDPLDDFDGAPSEAADETQRQSRSHQVKCLILVPCIIICKFCFL
jgi:serine/threonine-protein kinase mTOR